MVLLSQFWNGIKTGDHWTLKNLFNNQFNNILEGRCPFFQWEFLSFHPLGDFVTVFIQFYFAVFFKWKEISTYVFVRMKVYMYVGMCLCCYVCTVKSHNPLYGYFNDELFYLHRKYSDIVSQKVSLFGEYGRFACNLPQNYATLYSLICSKDFFLKNFTILVHNR